MCSRVKPGRRIPGRKSHTSPPLGECSPNARDDKLAEFIQFSYRVHFRKLSSRKLDELATEARARWPQRVLLSGTHLPGLTREQEVK